MKKISRWIKRTWVACLALFMAVILSSCSPLSMALALLDFIGIQIETPIFLEYTLTEEDLESMKTAAKDCEKAGMEGDMLKFTVSSSTMVSEYMYIVDQANIAYLNYCMDTTDEEGVANYVESEKIAADARTVYLGTLKKLVNDSPIGEELSASLGKDEMTILSADFENVARYELAVSEAQRQFYTVEEGENWVTEVSKLYEEVVKNNRKLADEYGYGNYYDYASDLIYARKYEQRLVKEFRKYVNKYLVPLFQEVYNEYVEFQASFTEAEKLEYQKLYNNYDLVNSYMDTFNVNMKRDMQAMGTVKNASIVAKNKKARPGAYTMYLNSAQQPIAYFGPGYQDIFTYVHEQGHYLAARYLEGMPRSVDFAELHSQGNEWLFMAYLDGVVDEKIYKGLLLDNVVNGLITIISCTVTDHFEEMVYKNDYTLMADAYKGVMDLVWKEYPGLEETLSKVAGYDFYEYALRVSLLQPGYYLSYATSQIAAMGIYANCYKEGYAKTQAKYESLMVDESLLLAIKEAGLMSPFKKETYEELRKVFLGEESVEEATMY